MLIRSKHFAEDFRNHDWTSEQLEEGAKLAALVRANVGNEAAMEAAVKKAGFTQDSLGQFFIVKGAISSIDKLTGEKSQAANVLHVPTPVELTAGLPRTATRRGGIPEATPAL